MATADQSSSRATTYPGLVRPDAITKLPNLNADQKSRFYSAVQQWWSIIESSGPETTQHQAALTKLRDMTKSVANIWRGNQQAARNGQTAAQASSAGQQQAVPTQASQLQQQRQLQEQQTAADSKRPQSSTAASQPVGAPAQGQQAQGAAGQQRRLQPTKEILAHVETFPYIVPPQYQEGSEEANTWLVTTKQNYGQLLAQFEFLHGQSNILLKKVEITKSEGQPIPENVLQSYKGLMHKKELLKKQIETFRLQQGKLKLAAEAAESKANAAPPAQASSPAATSAPPTTLPQASSTSAPSQPPTSAPTARPSINTNQPSAPAGSAPPSAATPTAPMAQQQPQHQRAGEGPLTHQGALDAARAYRDSQPNRVAATVAAPERDPASQPSQAQLQQRHHGISRTLPQSVMAPPAPVTVAPGRPTLAGAGAINQPTLIKPPPFQLEGDGASHVLSKRKLDELVRQVTGGAETLSPEVEEVSFPGFFNANVI